jgi:hypothetical protein
VKRGELLEEVHSALTVFSNAAVQFELWYCELLDAVESRDILKLEIPEYGVKIDEIVAKRDAKQGEFDGIVRNGKNLVAKKDVTDTVPVRDKIKVCLYIQRMHVRINCSIFDITFIQLYYKSKAMLNCMRV